MQPHEVQVATTNSTLAPAILTLLNQAPRAVSLAQLLKEFTLRLQFPPETVHAALQQLEAAGSIYVWGTKARLAYWTRDPLQECRTAILDAVRATPLTAANLKIIASKTFPGITAPEFAALMKRLLSEKALFEHLSARKGARPAYATEPSSPITLDSVILSKFKRQRLAVSAILADVLPSRPGTTESDVVQALHRLEKAGRVFRHPPIKKAVGLKWGKERPNLAAQFNTLMTIEKKRTSLLVFGFAEEVIDAAIRSKLPRGVIAQEIPDELAERILLVVRAARHPVIALPALRGVIRRSKPDFDNAVLQLRNAGIVRLFAHDHPFALSESQREELVTEPRDCFYAGIGLA